MAKKDIPYKTVAEVDERIAALNAEIEDLNQTVKAKKKEVKELVRSRIVVEKMEAEARAEEAKAELMKAIEESGKSYDDVIRMVRGW